MKRIIITLSCFFLIQGVIAQFRVTVQTPSYDSGLSYLTYHMGKNLNITDSGIISSKGTVVFLGKDTLPAGIYAVVFPGKRFSLDFFIDGKPGQNIRIEADTNNLVAATVTGSPENELFQQYQSYIGIKGGLLQQAKNSYNASTTKKDSALYEANYKKINDELNEYRNGIIKNNPQSMMALYLQTMKDPDVLNPKPVTRQDSLDNYYYYRAHYWDGVTFMDSRVIRTPFFLPKFERYYNDILPQEPDSIIKDLDYKLLLARSAPDMYKFLLNWATDQYISPKYMGQDAVFVHLFNKYHSKGLTPWLNEKQMETINRRAYMLMANLIGAQAANLEMLDTANKPVSLYQLKSDYTIVVFWDPNCGHCKDEIPRMDSIYRASWKQKNVKMFAVLSEEENLKGWLEFIHTHHLEDWTHAHETKEMGDAVAAAQKPGFRQLYDVVSTPTIYLLDSEKRIIGKKLTWSQLNDLLNVKWSQKK